MKLRIAGSLVLLTALVCATPARADEMQFSVKGGVNVAKAHEDGCSGTNCGLDNKTGFIGGVALTLPVSSVFSIQPEALFAMNGGKHSESGAEFTLKANYIEIPVLAKIDLAPSSSMMPFIIVGPQFGIRMSAKTKTDISGGVSVDGDWATSPTDYVKKSAVDVVFGGGVSLTRMIGVEARYAFGVSDVLSDAAHAAAAQVTPNKVTNRAFSVLLDINLSK